MVAAKTTIRKSYVSTENNPTKTNICKMNICKKLDLEQEYSKLHFTLNTNSFDLNNEDKLSICCREQESEQILTFLQTHLIKVTTQTTNHILYVYGPPGTGKTLTIRKVVDYYKNSCQTECIIPSVYINCMTYNSFKTVDAFYGYISSKIDCDEKRERLSKNNVNTRVGKSVKVAKSSRTQNNIVDILRNISSEYPILLIMDEIDSLKKPQMNLIRQFFDKSIDNNINFVVVTVSNNFTFFKPKEIREYNIEKLNFKTYKSDQLEKILQSALKESVGLVDRMALKLCSMRVAATTGDIRRAQSVLKTALEYNCDTLADLNDKNSILIDVKSVHMALEQIYGSKLKNNVSSVQQKSSTLALEIPFQQLLLLCCLLKSNRVTKCSKNKNIKGAVGIRHIYDFYYCESCRQLKIEALTYEEISQMFSLLETRGFVQLKSARKQSGVLNVSLLVSEQEIVSFISKNSILTSLFVD